MNFTIKQLEIFAAVAETKSISLAAKKLHLTPPAISKQIKNFESAVKLKLFNTVGKKILLTKVGYQLNTEIGNYLEKTEQLKQKIICINQEKPTNISLSINNSTQHITLNLLTQFQNTHPLVNFELSVAFWLAQQKQLKKNMFDFYIMGDSDIDKKNYEVDVIGYFSFKLVASSTHPLANKKINLSMLKNERFITANNPSTSQLFQNELLKKWGLEKKPMVAESYASIREIVKTGIGIALLPAEVINKEIENGELVYLDFPFKSKRFPIQLVYNKKQKMPELCIEFKNFIIDNWNQ